jgi:hypothetical protein
MNKQLLGKTALMLMLLTGLVTVQAVAMAALPPITPLDPNIPLQPLLPNSPTLAVVTPVPVTTYDKTPNFTFSSTTSGVISYGGDCSSATTDAVAGNNTITFNALDFGLHSNCTVSVKGGLLNILSAPLDVPDFTVKLGIIIDITPPTLTLVSGVSSPTDDVTPSMVFKSNEEGTISYEGSCFSTTNAAVDGDNTITFQTLAAGTYNNCKIRVTDLSGNISEALVVPSFTVNGAIVLAKCAGFTDLTILDSDCSAIQYVKSIGAITGNPDGTFDPAGLLQRDQISKIALEAFNKFDNTTNYCNGQNPFPDVAEASWAYQYVCRAKALSVVTGYLSGADAGYFRPARTVNRAEFLAIILRNLGEMMPTGASYTDVSADAWFAGYAKYSKDNSLFGGTKLYPTNFTTRREVAQVLYRLHNLGKI